MDYKTKQNQWIKENNIKVGDKVKIVRSAMSYEYGWENVWISIMDKYIGKVFTIEPESYTGNRGIMLGDAKHYFPWFVLEPVNKIEEKSCKCPRCSATLTRVMSYVYNVEIDKCPACGWC